jgi:5-methylcytosine-specific restriction endonuclease McrA
MPDHRIQAQLYAMKIITRKCAKAAGLNRYFTGKPCLRGHIAERITAIGYCHQCELDRKRAIRSAKPGYQTRAQIDMRRTSRTRRCMACDNVFPNIKKHFVPLTKTLTNGTAWNGLSAECRECRNRRFQPWYANNSESCIARAIKSTEKRRQRPEVREAERIWAREHKRQQLQDPAYRIVHNRRWRQWAKENPHTTKVNRHNRRARELGADGTHTVVDIARLIKKQGDACFWCHEIIPSGKHHVDHKIPLSRGGSNWPQNLAITCATCNFRKRDMMPNEFRIYRKKYAWA